jgi:hypothetical protein
VINELAGKIEEAGAGDDLATAACPQRQLHRAREHSKTPTSQDRSPNPSAFACRPQPGLLPFAFGVA